MGPEAAKDQAESLVKSGIAVEVLRANSQTYVLARGLEAPSPPWDRQTYDILIAIPASDAAGLDAFYLGLPYTFGGGTHPRVNGDTITVNDRQWRLVSWHYPDGKPWTRGVDDLASHLMQCKGFFLHRGATNAR